MFTHLFYEMSEGYQTIMLQAMCNEGFYLFLDEHIKVLESQMINLDPEAEDFLSKARELKFHRSFWLSLKELLNKEQAHA